MLARELQGFADFGDLFGMGTMSLCDEGKRHEANLTCGHCNPQKVLENYAVDSHDKTFSGKLDVEGIRRHLYLLHSATGHGQVKHMIQTLKRKGVPKEVLDEAEKFVVVFAKNERNLNPECCLLWNLFLRN